MPAPPPCPTACGTDAGGWPAAEPGRHDGTGVWAIDLALPGAALARCEAILSEAERARMERFLRPGDRARYAVSHAALRLILGAALGRDPRALPFVVGPGGRPELAGREISFNLSHSGSRALVALSPEATVGVDVETLRPLPDALRIARSHFAPDETAGLARLDATAREAAFFAVWTRKEAVVKALGAGLALPLDRFSVSLPPGPARLLRLQGGEAGAWSLHHLEPGAGTLGALAAAGTVRGLACRALSPAWPALLP